MPTSKAHTQIILANGIKFNITLADLNSFLNTCYSMDLKLEDFEDLFLDISDAVTEQTFDEAKARELKIKLIFLRKLNFLFKSMLRPVD